LRAALQRRKFRERLAAIGSDAVGSTSEEFGALLVAETEKWNRVVRGANLYHSQ
jgi:tripartite-type tricarboxylate transporter receptor subunit TctC